MYSVPVEKTKNCHPDRSGGISIYMSTISAFLLIIPATLPFFNSYSNRGTLLLI